MTHRKRTAPLDVVPPAQGPVSVTAFFQAEVRRRLRARGCLLLHNPDGLLVGAAQEMASELGGVIVEAGSSLEVKVQAEPVFGALRGQGSYDLGRALLVVVRVRPDKASEDPYLEYARAGDLWTVTLPELVEQALTGSLSPAQVAELFRSHPDLTLAQADDLAGAQAVQTHLFQPVYGVTDADSIVERFAWDAGPDAQVPQEALYKVVQARLGVGLEGTAQEAREALWTHLFTVALQAPGEQPSPEAARARTLLGTLRDTRPELFAAQATRVEAQLPADALALVPGAEVWLPAQDDAQQDTVVHAIRGNRAADAAAVFAEMTSGGRAFWATRPERQAAWATLRAAQEVLAQALHLRGHLKGTLAHLVNEYVGRWHGLDRAARTLDTFTDVPEQVRPAADHARRLMRDATEELAHATLAAYRESGTDLPLPPQTRIYADAVAPFVKDGPVAYLLIDALRFDLGMDLLGLLDAPEHGLMLHLEARSATLPTVTPFGMASLLPGAEEGLSVTAGGVPTVSGLPLKDLAARQKYLRDAVPTAQPLDTTLDKLPSEATLKKRLESGIRLIVVREGRLDEFGEVDAAPAAATFAHVLRDIRDATLALLRAGVTRVVIATDHGFLMLPGDNANKVSTPGSGVLSKRRVWLGELPLHSTPPGALAVPATAAHLGGEGAADLTLLFPPGRALFTTTGNMNYTHGGPTLQERVIPLLTVTRAADAADSPAGPARSAKRGPALELEATFGDVPAPGFQLVTLRRSAPLMHEPVTLRVDLTAGDDAEPGRGSLLAPASPTGEITLGDEALPLMFTVPHPGPWRLSVQDARGRALLSQDSHAAPAEPARPAGGWQTPPGAAEPPARLTPLLDALARQRDLSAEDIDALVKTHGLKRADRRAFDEYLDALAQPHPHLVVRDTTTTPPRYRMGEK